MDCYAKKINADLSKLFAPSIPAVILRTMSNLRIRSGQRNKIMRLLHRDLAVDEHIVNVFFTNCQLVLC